MGVIDRLRAWADRVGLIRVIEVEGQDGSGDDPQGGGPEATGVSGVVTRTVTLSELASIVEVRTAEGEVIGEGAAPANLPDPVELARRCAGEPGTGWSVLRFAEEVERLGLRERERGDAVTALMAAMAEQAAESREVLRDAAMRDRAIDAFGARAAEAMSGRREAREAEIAALRRRIGEIQASQAAEDRTWAAWVERKRAMEDRWIEALRYLVADPPVTRD